MLLRGAENAQQTTEFRQLLYMLTEQILFLQDSCVSILYNKYQTYRLLWLHVTA